MECTRWRKNQQAYLEVIWKENKTDDVICLHFGVYGNTCGHMIPSSELEDQELCLQRLLLVWPLNCSPNVVSIIVPGTYTNCSTFAHILERMWFICAHNFPR